MTIDQNTTANKYAHLPDPDMSVGEVPNISLPNVDIDLSPKNLTRLNLLMQGLDDKSILGTISDITSVTVFTLSFLIKAISESTDINTLKAKINTDLVPLSNAIQTAVADGTLKLPYANKPNASQQVFADLVALNNKVDIAMTEAKKGVLISS